MVYGDDLGRVRDIFDNDQAFFRPHVEAQVAEVEACRHFGFYAHDSFFAEDPPIVRVVVFVVVQFGKVALYRDQFGDRFDFLQDDACLFLCFDFLFGAVPGAGRPEAEEEQSEEGQEGQCGAYGAHAVKFG